jgi:hypothetical protein
VSGPLRLKQDDRDDCLVIIAGAVIDLAQRHAKQVHLALLLERRVGHLALIKIDHRQNQQLRRGGEEQSPERLAVRCPEARARLDYGVPGQRLPGDQGNQSTAPPRDHRGDDHGEENQRVGCALAEHRAERQSDEGHHDRNRQSDRKLDQPARISARISAGQAFRQRRSEYPFDDAAPNALAAVRAAQTGCVT